MRAVAVVMENFGASAESPLEICKDEILRSDAVVLILGHRYGAVLPGADSSLPEFEYSTARQADKPVFAFIADPKYPWSPQFIDFGETAERLAAFKRRLMSELVVGFFTSPSDLKLRVVRALDEYLLKRGVAPNGVGLTDAATDDVPDANERNPVLIRMEEHLNFIRTGVSELRDALDRAGKNTAPTIGFARQPALFLGPPAASSHDDLCFVAMPYSKDWSKALEDILLDICAGSGMRLIIAKNMNGRFIPHDIWQGITAATVIIADITDGNPNVAYEIGLADVLGKEVILLCQGNDVPFDFLGQRLICYENTMKGSIVLREELTARLRRADPKN